MIDLEGKVAVITGGASGIGEAAVRRFLAAGAKVVLGDLDEERGRALAAELGPDVAFRRTDVAEEADVAGLIGFALERFGRLDTLFNNAGLPGPSGPIAEIDAEGFDRAYRVLLKGPFLGIKHAAPILAKQRSGSIISTASVAGLQGGFGPHPYSALKAAVIQLTRTTSLELAEKNVRVNCICPGGIATPIFGRAMGFGEAQVTQTVAVMKQALSAMHPIGRSGMPEDIADTALWLASDASSFVTGQAIVVDGGLTAGRAWSQSQEGMQQVRKILTSIVGQPEGQG